MREKTIFSVFKVAIGKAPIELREGAIPAIIDDKGLIKVLATRLCVNDFNICHHEFSFWSPVILGHH